MAEKFILASHTVTEHLLRGAVGLSLFAIAMDQLGGHPIRALVLILVSGVALRGCPACWTVGLLHTAWTRLRGRPAPSPACPLPQRAPMRKESLDTPPPRC